MDRYENLKLDNQLCFSLYAAAREVIRLYKPLLDKHGLTYTQYIVMLVLWENKKITVKQIGEKLHLDSGTLTPLLKKLEAMDLIFKYRCPKDDRVVIVELSERGKALKDQVIEIPEVAFSKLCINKEEFINLKYSLDQLLKTLN